MSAEICSPKPQVVLLPGSVRPQKYTGQEAGGRLSVGPFLSSLVVHCILVQAVPNAANKLSEADIDALTKRTQDGGTEVVQAKAGKVGVQTCILLEKSAFARALCNLRQPGGLELPPAHILLSPVFTPSFAAFTLTGLCYLVHGLRRRSVC